MTTVAQAQRHLEDKADVILRGELATRLATMTIPGVTDRLGALDIAVGLNTEGLPSQMQGDSFPRVEVYIDGSESDNEALEHTTTRWIVGVAAVVQLDTGTPRFAARAAQLLASVAGEVLEQYLADPTAASTTPIWDVRMVSPVSLASATIDETRVHTIRASCGIEAYTRTDLAFDPTYAAPSVTPTGHVLVAAVDANAFVDATNLGATPLNRDTTVNISAAQLAAGTYVGVDVDAVASWTAASPWSVFLGRHNATVTGTTTASNPRVALASYGVADGDRWVVTVEDASTKTLGVWIVTWNVT